MKYTILYKNDYMYLLLVFFALSANCYSQNTFPSSGNVGIGTTNAIDKLTLDEGNITLGNTSSKEYQVIFRPSDNSWRSAVIGYSSGSVYEDYIGFRSLYGSIRFSSGQDTERMRITNQGRVGIGTDSPDYTLDVNGVVGTQSIVFRKSDNSGTPSFDLSGNGLMIHLSGRGLIAKENNIQDIGTPGWKFRNLWLANNALIEGRVGIGTTSPDSKLAVNGTVHAKEVKVDLSNWSDFVFKNSYSLPTLKEVANHIKKYGHLKDIPSAKEVEENGILLGEMDAKLLQKIEELTLYTIQQDNKLQKQDELIAILLNKMKTLEKALRTVETLPNE